MDFLEKKNYSPYILTFITISLVLTITGIFLAYRFNTIKTQELHQSTKTDLERIIDYNKIHRQKLEEDILISGRIITELITSNNEIYQSSNDSTLKEAIDIETGRNIEIYVPKHYFNTKDISDIKQFIDKIGRVSGSAVAIWQETKQGYLKVAATRMSIGEQETRGDFIYKISTIVQTVEKENRYTKTEISGMNITEQVYFPISIGETGKIIVQVSLSDNVTVFLNKFFSANKNTSVIPFFLNSKAIPIVQTDFPKEIYNTSLFKKMVLKNENINTLEVSESDSQGKLPSGIVIFHKDIKTNTFIGYFISDKETRKELRAHKILISILLFSSGLIIFIIIIFSRRSEENYNNYVVKNIEELSKGDYLSISKNIKSGPMGTVARFANIIAEQAKKASDVLKNIRNENYENIFEYVHRHDSLKHEILDLQAKFAEEKKTTNEKINKEKLERIINTGIERVTEILQLSDDLQTMSDNIISEVIKYLNVSQGGLFFINREDPDNPILELKSSFAYSKKRLSVKTLPIDYGLTGRSILEQQSIYLTEIPVDYTELISGFGESPPKYIAIVPLIFNNKVYGVIEIASLFEIEPYKIEFLEKIGQSISSTYNNFSINLITEKLLGRSREQSQAMIEKDLDMQKRIESLNKYRKYTDVKVFEVENILSSIYAGTLVVEYTTDGKIVSSNTNFVSMLNAKGEELIGKEYREISEYADADLSYTDFLKRLTKGVMQNYVAKFLYKNKQAVWLSQTFNPVFDKKGKVYRILSISIDITDRVNEKESLVHREKEIKEKERFIDRKLEETEKVWDTSKRTKIMMDKILSVVDDIFIRIDYDLEGNILEINDKAKELLKYKYNEMKGHKLSEFLIEDDKINYEKIINKTLKGTAVNQTVTFIAKDDTLKRVLHICSPLRSEDDIIEKIFSVSIQI